MITLPGDCTIQRQLAATPYFYAAWSGYIPILLSMGISRLNDGPMTLPVWNGYGYEWRLGPLRVVAPYTALWVTPVFAGPGEKEDR